MKTDCGVYLTGTVATQEEKDQIIKIAQEVKGVEEVVERIDIKP